MFNSALFSVTCPSEEWIGGGYADCYYFGSEAGDLNFYQAEEFCRNLTKESGLAEIHDNLHQVLIEAALKNEKWSKYDWWLGATDEYQVKSKIQIPI